ncbi:MAG: flagellar biosynthesis protein [Deltaproteobacteria bacterium]|nr:flagellar biosynthesis protein [Deltaproteobacteria bacterium]
MMSSSNIIKQNSAEVRNFEKFTFETILHAADSTRQTAQTPVFVPFLETLPGHSAPTADQNSPLADSKDQASHEQIVPELPVLVGIPEEVHAQQVHEAHEKGFEEGKRQAERGLANVFKALRDAVEELVSLKEHVLRASEEDLLKLAVMIARKVIHQEIATDRLILAKVVSAAVSNASDRDELIIRLNPEDHRLVSAHKHLYLNGCNDERLVELRADEVIPPGGCIVDTVMGEIDARTDSQIDEILRRLLDEKTSFMSLPATLAGEREHHAYEEN